MVNRKYYNTSVPKKLNINSSNNSLLDNTSITCRSLINLKKRKARFWNRILSFITVLRSKRIKGYRFSFLTLTSSPQSPIDILNSWNTLKKRIQRHYNRIYAFIVREYNSTGNLIHLHILLYAPYIEVTWLSANWEDIHNAKIVYIESVNDNKLHHKILGYMAKYIGKNIDTDTTYVFVRSFSYSMFYRGIARLWRLFIKVYLHVYHHIVVNDLIAKWDKLITI